MGMTNARAQLNLLKDFPHIINKKKNANKY
jgi:hypothetical protein